MVFCRGACPPDCFTLFRSLQLKPIERALTSEQVRNDVELIAALLAATDKRTARSRAIVIFSALVGAMSLARAVSDEAFSREILKAVAEYLKKFASKHQASKGRRKVAPLSD